jgi:hypothetical protein
MIQIIRHGKCRTVLHTPLSPGCLSPLRRPLLPSPHLLPIHGNDKTVTNRAVFEVGNFTPPAGLCPSIASFIRHSRPGAVNNARPSRLVCRKSKLVTLLDLPFTRFNCAGLTSIKKHRTRSAARHGIYRPRKPNIARLVEVAVFPSPDIYALTPREQLHRRATKNGSGEAARKASSR